MKLCRKRNRTEEEKEMAHLHKYQLLSPCGPCRLRCDDKFTHSERETINKRYWSCTFGERRAWLDSHINIYPVKRRRHNHNRHNHKQTRAHSLTYTLPKGTGKVPVCKTMFLRTLGLRTDGTLTEFVSAKQCSAQDSVAPVTDHRGKNTPPNKVDHSTIRQHINSYNPQVSHYNIAHAPHRRYLESSLTITGELIAY